MATRVKIEFISPSRDFRNEYFWRNLSFNKGNNWTVMAPEEDARIAAGEPKVFKVYYPMDSDDRLERLESRIAVLEAKFDEPKAKPKRPNKTDELGE